MCMCIFHIYDQYEEVNSWLVRECLQFLQEVIVLMHGGQ